MNSTSKDDDLSVFILDDTIDDSVNEWRFSLIGRLDLVKLKMETVETSLRKQWDVKGILQLIPLGKGFFIIKLDNEEDRKMIWKGHWIVESQDLKLRVWEPNFNPDNQKITSAFIWVMSPGLSIEYWKEDIILKMGNKVGRAIRVDETTLKSGFYASVVDMTNPIPIKISLESKYEKFEQAIQIPKLPKFCIHCSVIGHHVAECMSKRKEQQQETMIELPPKKEIFNEEENVEAFHPEHRGESSNSESFHILQDKTEELQELLKSQNSTLPVKQILEVSSNTPSINNVIQVTQPVITTSKHRVTQGTKEDGLKEGNKLKIKPVRNVTTRNQAAQKNEVSAGNSRNSGRRGPLSPQHPSK
ncbi:uncharacterized protein LOC113332786 [Papaver somniferum]|uniref:uncharacterized protein LOC113332786 n=1 Tax=Papaver somniferum TaxID=3469 RepID=UPI000E705BB3|nr:uncharacterized protein LOC113332786 [Papaver somniferum]